MTKEEREVMQMALEALEIGRCYAESENFENKLKFRGYEHLMPTDAIESIDEIKTVIKAIEKCLANDALEKKAENARELGLEY